jgi:hypothetical protein
VGPIDCASTETLQVRLPCVGRCIACRGWRHALTLDATVQLSLCAARGRGEREEWRTPDATPTTGACGSGRGVGTRPRSAEEDAGVARCLPQPRVEAGDRVMLGGWQDQLP